LNFSVPIVAAKSSRRAYVGITRALGFAAAVLALSACGRLFVRAPPPAAKSVPAPTPPRVAVLAPGDTGAETERIKRILAQHRGDALTHADVGYYMDVLVGRLEQAVGGGIVILRQDDRRLIGLRLRVGFEPGSVRVESRLGALLKRLAGVLVEYRKTLIEVRMCITGSSAGGVDSRLARQRAIAVARRLTDAGVAAKRIVVVPFKSQTAHVVDPDCRRVDLRLEPIIRELDGKR
jgi:outer membrane protein OmpA-like peptidoglycan-associated protein